MDDNNQDAPLKVIINGQEFDPTEAQELIDTGRKTREMEEKWNTKLDNVWPEYGKSREQLKTYESELTEARSQLAEFNKKKEEGVETKQDVSEAQEAARKLGIVLAPDLDKAGYVKRDDLDAYFQKKEAEKSAVDQILSRADSLEKEIDGTDGRPKFNKRAVLAYAGAYKIQDLQQAYDEMNEDSIKPWKEQQIASQKAKGLKTLKGGDSKSPKEPKINNDNLKEALRESLYGSQE
jgi:hypothetical protein